MVTDIHSKISESISIDNENYRFTTSKKSLWKFLMKIRVLDQDSFTKQVRKFVSDKMKNKNAYHLKEVEDQALFELTEALVKYMEDYLVALNESEVEDSINRIKTYTITVPNKEELEAILNE